MPHFKTPGGRTLVYFQGLYITEEEREAFIKEELERKKRNQAVLDQIAGVHNATNSQVLLKLFRDHKRTIDSDIKQAKKYFLHLKRNLNEEVFDKENISSTSTVVKRLFYQLLYTKKKLEPMYYALGSSSVRLTEGKEIKSCLDEISEVITRCANLGLLMNRVHYKIHKKQRRGR